MKRMIKLLTVLVVAMSNILVSAVTVVQAEGIQDVSSQLLSKITTDTNEVNDGGRLKITAEFNDQNKKIQNGDTINLSWPKMNNVEIKGFAIEKEIKVDGIAVGTAVITLTGATITFNEVVEQFDQGTVHGGVTFQVTANNYNNGASSESINIVGGNQIKEVVVSKGEPGPDPGPGTADFTTKNGGIYAEKPTEVLWDVSVNNNAEKLNSDLKIVDTLKESPNAHELKPETIEIYVEGVTNQMYRGEGALDNFKRDFNATVDYSLENGTVNIVIPQATATQNKFRIMYKSEIKDMDVAFFKNTVETDYQVEGKEAQHDSKTHTIQNINADAWGDGSKTAKLTVVKKDSTTKLPLENAKFVLKDSTGNIVRDNLVSDKDGKIIVDKLAPEEYYLEEIEAPDGYKILTEAVFVSVNKPTIDVDIENTPKEVFGSIEVTKTDSKDSNKVLSGAKFALTEIATGKTFDLVTGEDGKAVVDQLPLGKYSLVETEAPEGYNLNSTPQEIEVKKDETTANKTSVSVTNEETIVLGGVEVLKIDAKDKTKALSGAKFELTEVATGKVHELVTGEDGKANINKLPLGKYTLVETEAPKGYLLDKTAKELEIIKDVTTKNTTSIQVTNTAITPWVPIEPSTPLGGVEVTKVDSKDETKVLSGAKFSLTEEATGKVHELVTDETGKASINQLPLGKYTLVETEAPKGYLLDKTAKELEIIKDVTTKNTTSITVENTATTPWVPIEPSTPLGGIEVIKVDAKDKTKVLSGAKFELTEEATGKTHELVTDETGKASINKLPLGKYSLVETEAPKGYLLDKTAKELEIIKDVTTKNTTSITVENTATTPWVPIEPSTPLGGIEVTKVDAKDKTKVLSGAKFSLTEEETGKTYELITDETGKASINQLPLGKYSLVETEAPKGYLLDSKIQELEITKDATTKNTTSIQVKNTAITPWVPIEPSTPLGGIEVTKVDSKDETKVLSGAKFELTEVATGEKHELVTGEDGKANINKLPLGKYSLVETEAPKGYLLDSKIQELEITKNATTKNTTSITVENTATTPWVPIEPSTPLGGIEVTKLDAKDKTKVLSGAKFSLTEEATGKTYELVTGEDGKASQNLLPLGKYSLVETKAPKGYLLDSKIQELEITKDTTTKNTTSIQVTNTAITPWVPIEPSTPLGGVEVTKVDSKDKIKVLSGAKFSLTEEATGKTYELVTGEDGKASINQLPLGKYTLVETEAPKGYLLDKTAKDLEITKNTTSITVTNEQEKPEKTAKSESNKQNKPNKVNQIQPVGKTIQKRMLPRTGEVSMNYLITIGLILLTCIGLVTVLRYKRKTNN
ncbi:SpaA isopeptide-forming pilin-related protein [Vagococcus sp.]|nr:SpaA isopeptide-forming pilin-related protein [Vagococcus sp.]